MNNLLISENLLKNYIFIIFLTLIFSETFLLDTSILYFCLIGFFLIINFERIKFTNFQLISLSILIIYLISSLILSENFFSVIINFKFYYGFLIFLLFLKLIKINQYLTKILRTLLLISCIYTFFDAFIINLFENINLHQEIHTAKYFNFYIRPPGIAGNSTISSLYILIIFFILKKFYLINFSKIEYFLILSSVFLLFSAVGFITLFTILFFLIYEPKKINFYLNVIIYFLLILFLLLLSFIVDPDIAQKLSAKYMFYILEEKIFFIKHIFLSQDLIYNKHSDLVYGDKFLDLTSEYRSCFNNYFGCQSAISYPITSGDMGFFGFIIAMGYLGLFTFLLVFFAFLKQSRENLFYSLFLIFVSFHYGLIFFNLGQFLFALIISKNLRMKYQ